MKTNVLLLLFSILFSFSMKVQANPYLLDQEKFIHLTQKEQREIIVHMMELMVELEAKFKKDSATVGVDQKDYERMVTKFQKFTELFLSSAYAQDEKNPLKYSKEYLDKLREQYPEDKDFSRFSDEFTKIFNSPYNKTGTCIFSGWVSQTGPDGKSCRHPLNIPDIQIKNRTTGKITYQPHPAKAAYKKTEKVPCPADRISCNPVVFGYANLKEKSLFCVEWKMIKTSTGGTGKASHNSSYNCMRQSLGLLNEKEKEEQSKVKPAVDDSETRMNYLAAQLAHPSNRDAFDNIHGHIFDACICPSTENPSSLSKGYRDYINPHRTCFGLMWSLRSLHGECNVDDATRPQFDSMNGFFQSWQDVKGFADKIKAYDPLGVEVDKEGQFGTQYQKVVTDPAFLAKNCPYVKNNSCQASCSDQKIGTDGKPFWECKFTSVVKNGRPHLSSIPEKDRVKKITDPNTKEISIAGATCPIELKGSDSCKAECEKGEETEGKKSWKCTIKEAIKGGVSIVEHLKTQNKLEHVISDASQKELDVEGLKCPIQIKDGNDNKCEISVGEFDKEAGKISVAAVFTTINEQKPEAKWKITGTTFKADDDSSNEVSLDWDGKKPVSIEVTSSAKDKLGKDEVITCSKLLPEAEEVKECSVSIEEKKADNDKYLVSISPEKLLDNEITWVGAQPVKEDKSYYLDWDGKEDLSLSAKIKVNDKEIECKAAKKTKSDETPGFGIEAEKESETNASIVVIAINIKIEGKDITASEAESQGYSIRWIRKAAEGLEFKKVEEKKKKEEKKKEDLPEAKDDDVLKQEDDTTEDTKDKDDEDKDKEKDEDKVDPGLAGQGKSLTAERKNKDYSVVAQLIKDGEVKASSSELKIPKVKVSPVIGPMNQMPRTIRNPGPGFRFKNEMR